MSNSQSHALPAGVFDAYLPSVLTDEDQLFESLDVLVNSVGIDVSTFCTGHRQDAPLFDSMSADTEAAETIQDNTDYSMQSQFSNTDDIDTYLCETSSVIPHPPNVFLSTSVMSTYDTKQSYISSPSSPKYVNCKQKRNFLVHDHTTGKDRRPYLYEFLRMLLENGEYSHIIQFIDRKQGVFKLLKPQDIAELWRYAKGRNSDNEMTYDKVARALRYYYSSEIMQPNPGRYTFKFGPKSGFGKSWWPVC
ncbi:unnamed protein product [Adineta ricciae]|uniref:ETS domain-containing protein n=1 Tax=Adineta ricciae TaxID=249248 RepID=A0A815NT03_ADIRI|nr:unnamed protein product [Adineta ricciae]CAF1436355.1 unnamed protein product [Adineta ricciae]